MTLEDLNNLELTFVSHLSMTDKHCATYRCDNPPMLVCQTTRYKDDRPCGRSYTHYKYKGKLYKTKPALLEAINEREK